MNGRYYKVIILLWMDIGQLGSELEVLEQESKAKGDSRDKCNMLIFTGRL